MLGDLVRLITARDELRLAIEHGYVLPSYAREVDRLSREIADRLPMRAA